MVRPKRQQPSLPKIHDRRTTDLLINAQVASAEVDDPYKKGDRIAVIRSIRDDPLARMYIRSQIDTAQFSAGREYQRIYGIVESGARAIDFTREAVDGGKFAEPFTDARKEASDALGKAYRALGADGTAIVRNVLGDGMMISQVAMRREMLGKHDLEYFGRRFRECLDCLAILWGFAQKPKQRT